MENGYSIDYSRQGKTMLYKPEIYGAYNAAGRLVKVDYIVRDEYKIPVSIVAHDMDGYRVQGAPGWFEKYTCDPDDCTSCLYWNCPNCVH